MRIRISARLPVLVASAATLLAGCAQPWQQYQAGQDESAIVARMGPPREIYDLPGGGTDEGADPVADPGGGVPPAGVVPAGDEVVAPLAVDDVGDGLGHTRREGPERVAVEVDDPRREAEPTAQVGGGVGGIELAGPLGQR